MFKETEVLLSGVPHTKHVILADVNIPYKFSIDRRNSKLFFCINAEEHSDQSFQSVVLSLDTGLASVIPGIRNGFASAVDQITSDVYLGGSDGIFKYDYRTNSVVQPGLVRGMDIFDMYFSNNLYFVDTRTQNLHLYKNKEICCVVETKGQLIQHFVMDVNRDLYYVNFSGLFVLTKGNKSPTLIETNGINICGATTDGYGTPFFIASDGIYGVDKENRRLFKLLSVNNGNGIAFDKNNKIIYSEDRSIIALIPNSTNDNILSII